MTLLGLWRWIARRAPAAPRKARYWLFYAGPENYLCDAGLRELPQEAFWSCERETREGDQIIVYRKSMDQLSVAVLASRFGMPENVAKRLKASRVGKDFPVIWEATSDAKRKLFWHWSYGCATKEIQRIDPPIPLTALKDDPRLRGWEGLRWNLQARGRSALEIPAFAWQIIIDMIRAPALER